MKLMSQKSQPNKEELFEAMSKQKAKKTMNLLQFGNRNQQSY